MNIKYKVLNNKSSVYKYVSNLKDIIKVDVVVTDERVDDFDINDGVGLTDEFQLIRNVEIILKDIESKVCHLDYSQSLIVYIEDYSDKYLFTKKNQ